MRCHKRKSTAIFKGKERDNVNKASLNPLSAFAVEISSPRKPYRGEVTVNSMEQMS